MRALLIVAIVIAGLLVAARIAAPYVALHVVNGVLATMPGYDARVRDVDLSVLGGWAAIDDLEIRRAGGTVPEPFVALDRAKVRPRWRAWLSGHRVVDLELDGLAVTYVLGRDAASSQTSIDPEWVRTELRRYPVAPDHLVIRSGSFRYSDRTVSPRAEVAVAPLEVEARNLANVARDPAELFGTIDARGTVERSGRLSVHAALDPFADAPRFELEARIDGLSLVDVNDVLRAYANFDVEAGTFSAVTKLDARGGAYSGTVTPKIDELKVTSLNEVTHDTPGNALWQVLVGAAAKIGEAVAPGPGKSDIDVSLPIKGTFAGRPPLLDVLMVLPASWFGSLERALRVGSAAGERATKAGTEAGKAVEPERADQPKKKKQR